jgi:hypothetical protein
MAVAERIIQRVQRLPEREQAVVLDFVDYLLAKAERAHSREEERAWSEESLTLAMRGMEAEPGPDYTAGDVQERFS